MNRIPFFCKETNLFTRFVFMLFPLQKQKGFRGSFGLLDGDTTTGESQFQKMLVLTIILVLGVYVGETVLPSKAVLNAW